MALKEREGHFLVFEIWKKSGNKLFPCPDDLEWPIVDKIVTGKSHRIGLKKIVLQSDTFKYLEYKTGVKDGVNVRKTNIMECDLKMITEPTTENDNDNDYSTSAKIQGSEKKKSKSTEFDILHELDVLSGGHGAENLECPSPLVPYQNRIVRTTTNSTAQERMIPKIMHFSMQSRCVPRDLLRTLNRWEMQLPEHSIFFHDDDAVDRLLSMDWSEFPGFHEGMKCVLYRGAMTIDIWRVLMLWKYGGLYSDIDNWPEDMFTESLIPGNVSACS
eukprot:scaffold909_cov143-Chaetoceros_neogracile.AAC.1